MSRTRAGKKALSLLVAESESMRAVVRAVEEFAGSGEPVLILGEAGTGRELIARILHFASPRRTGEFVSVHGGSAPANMLRDAPGATSQTTLGQAAGGSLLIKDLCELPRGEQRRLERVLRDRSDDRADDVLVIGSCDLDLSYAVEAGVFSSNLYERFDRRSIVVPPLRDRVADIPPLTAVLIREYGREVGKNKMTVSTRAYDRLVKYPWPGNVGELKGVARRLVYRATKRRIEAGDVDAVLPSVAERVPLEQMSFEEMVKSKLGAFLRRVDGYPLSGLYEDVISRVEKPMLDLVMKATGGNQLKAAEILGVNRNTLRRKLSDHGMLEKKRTRRATGRRRAESASDVG